MNQSGFGDLLRELRKERGLTLSRLAEASGVFNGQLSKLENGRKPPTVEIIGRLAPGLFWPHGLLPGLVRDAGGVDVLGEAGITPHLNEAGTLGEVGLDEALAFGADADFWCSSIWETTTPSDEARRVSSQIAATGRGAASRRFRRDRDVLHIGGVRVDLMLADLIALMSPTVLPAHEPLFPVRVGQG